MPGTAASASAPASVELDVAVELLEALLAGQLGPGGAEESAQRESGRRGSWCGPPVVEVGVEAARGQARP